MALPTSLHLGVSPEQRLLESFNRNKEGGKEEGKEKTNGLVSEGRHSNVYDFPFNRVKPEHSNRSHNRAYRWSSSCRQVNNIFGACVH